jgi:hypothetical protein
LKSSIVDLAGFVATDNSPLGNRGRWLGPPFRHHRGGLFFSRCRRIYARLFLEIHHFTNLWCDERDNCFDVACVFSGKHIHGNKYRLIDRFCGRLWRWYGVRGRKSRNRRTFWRLASLRCAPASQSCLWISPGQPLKKAARAAPFGDSPVSGVPAIESKFASFAESLWSTFEKFPFWGDEEQRLVRCSTVCPTCDQGDKE